MPYLVGYITVVAARMTSPLQPTAGSHARTYLLFVSFALLLVTLLPSHSHARLRGQARIDSLVKELESGHYSEDDTNKVKLLTDICYAYNSIRPAEGLKYGIDALVLAQSLEYKRGIADANAKIGVCHMRLSDYPKALSFLLTALKQYEALKDKKGIASAMGNIGNIYINQEQYDKALEYYHKIQDVFEELDMKAELSITLSNIANVYTNKGELDKALEYNYKALKLCEEANNLTGKGSNTQNIASIYQAKREYEKALEHYFDAMSTLREIGDRRGEAVCLGSIGDCYFAIVSDSIKVVPGKYVTASKPQMLKMSIDYLHRSLAICAEIGSLDNMQQYEEALSNALIKAGDYKGALQSYKRAVALYDSVYGNEAKIKILNLGIQRDLDMKSKQIELDKLAVAKKKNESIFYIVGICLLLLVIIVILRNNAQQKKSNEQISKEKKRSDDLLLNILPSEVADELKNTGRAKARHFNNVTVIFTDFVNFTKAGERMSPQELIDELHECFKAFDDINTKYGIEKIKTIGDAYLAVAGLPVADPKHAEHVICAAQDILKFMNERRARLGDKTFLIRIGVHTGSVVAGIVGVKKFAYDIWGDTVNTTARMEEHSEPGKINISQNTYNLVKDHFSCTYRGEIDVKNKGALSMYFVDERK